MCRTLDGKYVVPVVMTTEGVMNGILYPAAPLLASVPYWVGMPVVVGHPDMDEYGWLPRPAVGVVGDCWFAQGKLVANLLLDELYEQTPVSIGVQRLASIDAAGKWHGTPYTEVLQAMHPHHLALLVNSEPACAAAGLVANAAALPPLPGRPATGKYRIPTNTERGRCWAPRTANVWTERRTLLEPR